MVSKIESFFAPNGGLDTFLSGNGSTAKNGLNTVPISTTTPNGLPHSSTPNNKQGKFVRKLIHFFVPEIGIVKLYVNPENITINFKKTIDAQRTKGGYVLQYWGEDLTEISIMGTTGTSGIEGINVLLEIYRAEQYVFDNLGLTIDAANATSATSNFFTDNLFNSIAGSISGLAGLDTGVQALLPKSYPSLASLAFGLEMYHDGWVFRGFMRSLTLTESASNLGLYNYNISFTATQRRGYRQNSLPWQHSAKDGASNWDTIPLSFGDKSFIRDNSKSFTNVIKEATPYGINRNSSFKDIFDNGKTNIAPLSSQTRQNTTPR